MTADSCAELPIVPNACAAIRDVNSADAEGSAGAVRHGNKIAGAVGEEGGRSGRRRAGSKRPGKGS